ncbi:MAG: metallopeptidase TldD-related protein [Thermoanaerobaculia bacterium]
MTEETLCGELERRAPGQWELYRKSAESRQIETSRSLRRVLWRREEGWAARWWESGAPRFAAAAAPGALALAIPQAALLPAAGDPPPEWPSRASPMPAENPVEPPPDLFEELARAVAAASRGQARLAFLGLRRGKAAERVVNGAGLDVGQRHQTFDGVAQAIGRQGSRAHEVRLPFRWREAPEIEALARRLSDAATLPLADRPAPFAHGQWLLDPGVAAGILAALAPLFTAERPPRWMGRGRIAAPGLAIADDASGDAPFDGEGVPTRRVLLVEDGEIAGHLYDLRAATRAGTRSTGHGVRPSFRTPPSVSPRRLFFEARTPAAPEPLLASVRRGLFAAALTAPVHVDLERDRYEVEFTGISLLAGRAQGPVAGARAAGRISELLRRITGLSTDLQFFAAPFLTGAPTVLVERANFE